MFCLPKPHDRVETGPSVIIVGIASLDALLLLPALGNNGQDFLNTYGFVASHPTAFTFFSALFLHIGLWHYIGNMWFLYVFGKKIEATLGHLQFLLAFLICGIGGQTLYWLTSLHARIPCVGASGAISGIAGIYLVLYPTDRFDLILLLGWVRLKTFESTARVAVAAWIGEQFLLALITLFFPVSSVAFWAHVGGFATGMAVAALYRVYVPAAERPLFKTIEIPLTKEIAQPNPVIGLNLSNPAPLRAEQASYTIQQQDQP